MCTIIMGVRTTHPWESWQYLKQFQLPFNRITTTITFLHTCSMSSGLVVSKAKTMNRGPEIAHLWESYLSPQPDFEFPNQNQIVCSHLQQYLRL